MRNVKCYECGKRYNFDEDGFCPNCGAFNQPRAESYFSADGTVLRSEGINERNHSNSFVHAELHSENRKRAKLGLDKDLLPGGSGAKEKTIAEQNEERSAHSRRKANKVRVPIGKIILIIIILNLIGNLLETFGGF